MALTNAERQQRWRERRKDGEAPVRYRRPADRRSRVQQWNDAVETLLAIIDHCESWRENMPPALADSATAERIEEVLALRDLVEQLQGVDLPKGFGRD